MITISSVSKEYVRVPVADAEAGTDPTDVPVAFAFVDRSLRTAAGLPAPPGDADWVAGDWETVAGQYFARCLVGPGGSTVLAPGIYSVWLRLTDTPEVPVIRAGSIMVE